MKKYSESYEGGRCPLGYEFVNGYTDNSRVWHNSYCRKIRKFRNDPEERIRKQEQIEERKSHDRAVKAVLGAKHRDVFKIEDI